MTQRFTTGKAFTTGEQVTAQDLENIVELSTPLTALTDDQTLTVNNGQIIVKDGSSVNGVPLTKLKHIAGHSVVGNTGSATAAPTNIEVAANEAVLGNSAGNGLVTDKIGTDNIKDDAVTQGKTSFINPTTGSQTLTGTSPNLTFDDTNNVVTNKPFINGNTTDGGLHVRAQEANSVIQNLGTGKVLLATSDTPGSSVTDVSEFVTRLEVSSTSGKTQLGANTAGGKVTGGLYVTGDVYADDFVVADHILLQGDAPNITFNDSDVGTPNAYITGNGTAAEQKLLMYAPKGSSDIATHSTDNFTVKVTDNPTSDFHQSTNPYVERFRVAHDAGKDSSGTLSAGAKVSGDLQVTNDLHVTGESRIGTITSNPIIKNTSPKLTLQDTDNSGTDPYIISDNSGSIGVYSTEANSDVIIDGKDEVRIRHDGTNGIVVAADAGKDAAGTASAGAKVEGDLQVTGDINCAGDYSNINIKGSNPQLTLERNGVTNAPIVKGYDTGSLELVTQQAESDIILDAKDDVVLQYDNNTVFRAGDGQGREADNTFVAGCKVEGALQVTGEANIGKTKLGTDSILAATPSISDNSTKIATTAYVDRMTFGSTAIIKTDDARNGENQRHYKNLQIVNDPANLCDIVEQTREIKFNATGEYMIELGFSLQDNDGTTADEYHLKVLSDYSNTGSDINWGGVSLSGRSLTQNDDQIATLMFTYTVSSTDVDRLAFYAKEESGASGTAWEGRLILKATKIG